MAHSYQLYRRFELERASVTTPLEELKLLQELTAQMGGVCTSRFVENLDNYQDHDIVVDVVLPDGSSLSGSWVSGCRGVYMHPPAPMIMNLTPHEINIYVGETLALKVPPSGIVARCAVERKQTERLKLFGWVEVPVNETVLGTVEGLPSPEEGVYYVVSRVVAEAARDRDDLLIPDDTVRDPQGRVIGCRAFARI